MSQQSLTILSQNLKRGWDALETWSASQSSALVALQSLSVALSQLQSPSGPPQWPPVVDMLKEKVLTRGLSQFLSGSAAADPGLLNTISDCFEVLHSAQGASQAAAAGLKGVAWDAEQVVRAHSVQIAETQATVLKCIAQAALAHVSGAAGAEVWDETAPPSRGDVALVLSDLAEGLSKQATIQATVVNSLELDSPVGALAGYILVWETEPFVDDGSKELLQQWWQQSVGEQ